MLVVTGDDPVMLNEYGRMLDVELILLWPEVQYGIPSHPKDIIARVIRAAEEGADAVVTMSSVAIGAVLCLVRHRVLATEQVEVHYLRGTEDVTIPVDDDGDFTTPWPEPGYSIWEADLQLAIHGIPTPDELR